MENYRNSDCWYKAVCYDDCNLCNTYLELKWQMDNSGLPKAMQKPIDLYLYNECDKEAYLRLYVIKKGIVDYVAEGNNLYICGSSTGTGKTSWAVKVLQTLLHFTAQGNYEVLQGMFVSVPDLLMRMKDFQNPLPKEYKDNLANVSLVVWDDIAMSDISNYDYNVLYNFINNRVFAGKSNIYTSNVTTPEELSGMIGDRITSRVWNTSEIIEFTGKDVR